MSGDPPEVLRAVLRIILLAAVILGIGYLGYELIL